MKKLNMIEAAAVIGGTCEDVCTSSYERVTVGGSISCKEVTTCVDKHGNSTVTMKDAAKTMCQAGN